MKLPEIEKLERQKTIISRQRNKTASEPTKHLYGVRVKEWDKESKLYSLCLDCIHSIEPPTRQLVEGESGTRRCDWCEIKNVI
jgi:hypothetical protein